MESNLTFDDLGPLAPGVAKTGASVPKASIQKVQSTEEPTKLRNRRQDSFALTESEKNTFEVGRMLRNRYMSSIDSNTKEAGEKPTRTIKEILESFKSWQKK